MLKFTVKDMTAAENRAKEALKEYKCTLGGGTEWYTVGQDKSGELIQKFTAAVTNIF